MKNYTQLRWVLFVVLSIFTVTGFAWDHSIEFGYGYSHDPNNTHYNNSGFLLNGDFWTFKDTPWTHWALNAAAGTFHSTAPTNKNLTAAAVDMELRVYGPEFNGPTSTYFLASAGPAIMSSRYFGTNKQGSNLAIQSNLGLGMEFNLIDVNLRLEHFSNGGTSKPNEGFNILYLLSLGYLF